jgi:signal transduction histidine kinase
LNSLPPLPDGNADRITTILDFARRFPMSYIGCGWTKQRLENIFKNPLNLKEMAEIAALERAIETATTDLEKIQAMNALAEQLRDSDTQRVYLLAESVLKLIGDNQNYDHEKARALLALGWCNILTSNCDVSMEQSQKARLLFEQTDDQKGVAGSYSNIGIAYYRISDYPKALKYFQDSLCIRLDIGDKQGIASSLHNIGLIHFTQADYPKALKYFQDSLNASREISYKFVIASSLGNIGNIYFYLSDYPNALKSYQDCLSIKQDIGDKQGIAASLNNIGNVYWSQSDYANALKCYEESLSISRDIGNKQNISDALSNIGKVYFAHADYANALKVLQDSLCIRRDIGDKQCIADSLINIGSIYKVQGDYAKALKYFQDSLVIKQDIGDKQGIAISQTHLGSALLKLGRFDEAESHLQQAFSLCDEIDWKHLRLEALDILAQFYAEMKNFDKAYHTHIEVLNAHKLVFSEESQKQLNNLQARFETETARKEAEIFKLRNVELVNANQLKSDLIAMASHDLKNPLQVILGYSRLLEGCPSDAELATESAQMIHQVSNKMLALLTDLLSSAVATGTLELFKSNTLLTALVCKSLESMKLQAKVKQQQVTLSRMDEVTMSVDANRMTEVIDNIIGNAIKYSPIGSVIDVRLIKTESAVRFEVQDQGPGLSEADKQHLFERFRKLSARPTGGESSSGFGLFIVKQLVALHGGKVWAESQGKGKGTTFIVELPNG